MSNPELVLASNSPRRRRLLELGGWDFLTHAADVDESQRPGEAPGNYVLRLAETKALTCANSSRDDLVILAADTAVVDRETILGKPKDRVDAMEMLKRLRGHTHQVFTGIAVIRGSDGNMFTDLCVTEVPMRDYSDREIDSYIATGDPLDKAGAYAIQHPIFKPVENMTGCYASVMGLPLCHLTRTLRRIDIAPRTNISSECQADMNYSCPIHAAVLRGEQVG